MAQRLDDAEIREAARAVFARRGFSGASIEDIAAAAGVSRVTLHRRGLSKEVLLAQMLDQAVEDYRKAVWVALTAPGHAAQRLEQALRALCACAEQHLAVLLALRERTDNIFHEEGEEPLTRTVFTEPLERLLRDGAADGTLRDVDPLETATVLFNLVGWTYIHMRAGHGWPERRAVDGVLDIALGGLVERGATGS